MRKQLLFGVCVGAMLLLGCSPYRPFNGSTGYSEAPINADSYEVSFTGGSNMDATQGRYYATVRAAERAVQMGRPYILVEGASSLVQSDTHAVPGSATVIRSRDRRSGTSITTINEQPGYIATYNYLTTTIRVRMLDKPAPGSLNAMQVLRDAKAREKIKFDADVESRLAAGG